MSDISSPSAIEYLRGVRYPKSYELAYLWHCEGPFIAYSQAERDTIPRPGEPCSPRTPHPGWQNSYPCRWKLRVVARSHFPEDDWIANEAVRTIIW